MDERPASWWKRSIKEAFLSLLAFFSPGLGDRGCILMYHSVAETQHFFTVRPADLERQLRYLKDKKFTIVKLSELCRRIKAHEPVGGMVALTFDDGYEDFYTNAVPLLKKYDIPATVFVVAGMLGEEATFFRRGSRLTLLTAAQVRELAAGQLIDVMPHTLTHQKLDHLPLEEAVREIEGSRDALDELTGKKADILAYPVGRFTREIVDHLRLQGAWQGAVTTRTGLVRSSDDPYTLARVPVDSQTSFRQFRAKLTRATDLYERLKSI